MKKVKGVTFVELLFTITLLSLLLTMGIPGLSKWLLQNKVSALQSGLLHSINFARNQAINLKATITLCPGTEQCEGEWGSHIIIFSDVNSDGVIDSADQIFKKITLTETAGTLRWRSFRRKHYLQFNAQGLTNALNGTFHYCRPNSENNHYNFAIVLAKTGRMRVNHSPNCP